jgi:hypothetical protein
MTYGPKDDGAYIVEFKTAKGEVAGDHDTPHRVGRA